MISLVSLIASASTTGAIVSMCAKNDRQATRKPNKSSKSTKSKRSGSKSTKSHRSSSKSKRGTGKSSTRSHRSKSSKSGKGGKKSSKKQASKKTGKDGKVIPLAVPGGSSSGSKRGEDKKMRSDKSSRSRRSSKSSKKGKKCAATQCDKSKKKEKKKVSLTSDASSASTRSKRSAKKKNSGSLSSEKSGEKVLKTVPNSSNYKFPEVKTSNLKASPNKLPFAPSGGIQTVQITNSSKSRKAFKVKTSDNMIYRVNPVFGFVDPGDKMSIDVLRHNGSQKTDHLVVLTSDVTSDAKCAKGVFEANPPRELTVVPLVAH